MVPSTIAIDFGINSDLNRGYLFDIACKSNADQDALGVAYLEVLAVDRVQVAARSKALICAFIALLPSRVWPLASRMVRMLWPGFRNA